MARSGSIERVVRHQLATVGRDVGQQLMVLPLEELGARVATAGADEHLVLLVTAVGEVRLHERPHEERFLVADHVEPHDVHGRDRALVGAGPALPRQVAGQVLGQERAPAVGVDHSMSSPSPAWRLNQ